MREREEVKWWVGVAKVVLPIAVGTVYGSWYGADHLNHALNLHW